MFVPKIKLPEALIVAVPPIDVVPIITVLIEVMDKLFEEDKVKASCILTRPPKTTIEPARLIAFLIEIVPVLLTAPIVSPFPPVVELMF